MMMLRGTVRNFLQMEAAGGILLAIAAAFALFVANSAAAPYYQEWLDTLIAVQFGDFKIAKPWILWINDGLMAVFFLLVGLEIKRELLEGELSTPARAALPAIGALGGVLVPAAIYAAFNWNDPATLRGWAIPSATDIAFAVGVLSLLGSRVPSSLKVFLLALAIIDDLGAIIIIALFYAHGVTLGPLAGAGVCLILLYALNRRGVLHLAPYLLIGLVLWVLVLKSGIHATLAGVALAFAIPLRGGSDERKSPLKHMEHALHGWVAYAILPLFAFANAGVSLAGLSLHELLAPIPLGIALGLFVGKQVGVMAFSWLAIKLRVAALPPGATWLQFYGVAIVTGIGFTMSLFIGGLAFSDPLYAAEVRLGVLIGSIASALVGYGVLRMVAARKTVQTVG